MRINKEGYKIIGISGVVCVLIWWLFYHLLESDASEVLDPPEQIERRQHPQLNPSPKHAKP